MAVRRERPDRAGRPGAQPPVPAGESRTGARTPLRLARRSDERPDVRTDDGLGRGFLPRAGPARALAGRRDFRVSAYSTLGGSVFDIIDDTTLSDTEKDTKIKDLIDADYYDTVTDYIDIGNVRWEEDGSITITGWDGTEHDEEKYYGVMMRNLHEVLDEKGVNLVITILNPSGENGNQRVMKSITENRDTLITNMIAFCNKYEFDGIDLDWEFPMSQDEFDAYNSFLQELKARMKDEMWNKEESTLSLALGTWALKYTPENGNVQIFVSENNDSWSVEVKDTGIGIPASEQKKLFKLHFRASNAINSKVTGSGKWYRINAGRKTGQPSWR